MIHAKFRFILNNGVCSLSEVNYCLNPLEVFMKFILQLKAVN